MLPDRPISRFATAAPTVHVLVEGQIGAVFPTFDLYGYNTFAFARSFMQNHGDAFEVEREQFDAVVSRRAKDTGMHITEGCTVARIEFALAAVIAHRRHADGRRELISARCLVDASGSDHGQCGELPQAQFSGRRSEPDDA